MALETILVAVGPNDADRYEQLAEETITIGGAANAHVVLAHVFTDEQYTNALETLDIDMSTEEVTPDDVARRHGTTRDIAEILDEAGMGYEFRGSVGDHGDEIVAMAEAVDADLVIVGGRKRSPAGKAAFGSTAQQVMLEAPCPVTFVRVDTT